MNPSLGNDGNDDHGDDNHKLLKNNGNETAEEDPSEEAGLEQVNHTLNNLGDNKHDIKSNGATRSWR